MEDSDGRKYNKKNIWMWRKNEKLFQVHWIDMYALSCILHWLQYDDDWSQYYVLHNVYGKTYLYVNGAKYPYKKPLSHIFLSKLRNGI